MRKLIVAALFASALAVGTAHAEIYVRVGPPAPVYERHGPPPRPGWVWRAGYHRWDGAPLHLGSRRMGGPAASARSVGFPLTGCSVRAGGCWSAATGVIEG
jgi:hypothetical protein